MELTAQHQQGPEESYWGFDAYLIAPSRTLRDYNLTSSASRVLVPETLTACSTCRAPSRKRRVPPGKVQEILPS